MTAGRGDKKPQTKTKSHTVKD